MCSARHLTGMLPLHFNKGDSLTKGQAISLEVASAVDAV